MKQELVIGIAIAVVVLIAIKVWVFRLAKFKIDESTIVKFLKESGGDSGASSVEKIAAATGIGETRVVSVCMKSKAIKGNDDEKETWSLAS